MGQPATNTYISTMAVAMEAAAENGKSFVVLDRPRVALAVHRSTTVPSTVLISSTLTWSPGKARRPLPSTTSLAVSALMLAAILTILPSAIAMSDFGVAALARGYMGGL